MQNRTFSQRITWGWSSMQVFLLSTILVLLASAGSYAQTYNYDNITIQYSVNNTSPKPDPITYDGTLDPNGTNPAFDGAVIGGNGSVFSQSTGSIIVTAASANLSTTSSRPFTDAQLQYRVYATGSTTLPGYSVLPLNKTSAASTYDPTTFATSGQSVDILNQPAVLGAGNYTIDIIFISNYQVASRSGTISKSITDPSNTNNYGFRATFQVSAPPVTPSGGTSTWISQQSTDWTDQNNWSNGVPKSTSNAIIPGHDTGDPFTVSPILVASKTPYNVGTLTLQNSSNPVRATMFVQPGATLAVYGDLNQAGGGLDVSSTTHNQVADPANNSTIIFAGINQVIRGTLVGSDVVIGGSGTKSVVDAINAYNTLTMAPLNASDGVIIQSATESTNGSGTTPVVTFDTSLNKYINLGSTGILFGETNTSYVRGVLKADRALKSGVNENFGNLGLELSPSRDVVNTTLITRVVGAALNGPIGTGAKPIKRQYIVGGDVNNGVTVDVVFHYLNSADELNGIMENNLVLFRTVSGTVPYTIQNGTLDMNSKTVTRLAMTGGVYTLTLGDKTNPLPVRLTAFTAARSSQNVLLNWATATEQNNAGFEVQVSTDGSTFRKLTFISSQDPNSSQSLTYSYTDTEAGKTGTRYYRLRQLDVTGEETFSPVRAVSFDGTAGAVALSAYPNPFADKVEFNLDATAIGANGVAHVQLLDMTGRVVREQNLAVQNASLTLDNLNALRSGLYMARITLPDGSTKSLRVQKQ